jgi:hypothetical protein
MASKNLKWRCITVLRRKVALGAAAVLSAIALLCLQQPLRGDM